MIAGGEEAAEAEEPASRRARLRAQRRARKIGPRPMAVSGKSVFLLKQQIERKAREAAERRAGQKKASGRRRARRASS